MQEIKLKQGSSLLFGGTVYRRPWVDVPESEKPAYETFELGDMQVVIGVSSPQNVLKHQFVVEQEGSDFMTRPLVLKDYKYQYRVEVGLKYGDTSILALENIILDVTPSALGVEISDAEVTEPPTIGVSNDDLGDYEYKIVIVASGDRLNLNGSSNPNFSNAILLGRIFNGAFPEAPQDGKTYARENGQWVQINAAQTQLYGVEFDTEVSSPTLTRIGNMELHRTLPIQSKMRGCLLNDNGDVVEYLTPNNWAAHDLSGESGQVMVEIPRHYRRFEEEGTKRRVYMSEYALTGYEEVPKSYVSAYEASVQRSTNTLSSVKNSSVDYRGGDNNAEWDDTYRSLLGRPLSNVGRGNLRTYARKRKANSSEWNVYLYTQHETIYWLFCVEYATRNCQADFNAELSPEGYKQGGIGAGVTGLNRTLMGNFNNRSPFVPCGYSDNLGNSSGEVLYQMPNEYSAEATSVSVNRYRGIECPFGHMEKNTDGNIIISGTGDDGKTELYVSDNPEIFNDSYPDGYTYMGEFNRSSGYIKNIAFLNGSTRVIDANGSSSTYYCARFSSGAPMYGGVLSARVGGHNADPLAACNFMTYNIWNNPTYPEGCTRLSFIPNN